MQAKFTSNLHIFEILNLIADCYIRVFYWRVSCCSIREYYSIFGFVYYSIFGWVYHITVINVYCILFTLLSVFLYNVTKNLRRQDNFHNIVVTGCSYNA